MPQTRKEKIIFGITMSIAMAVGMEVYNVAINMGFIKNFSAITYSVLIDALKEASFMWIIVFIVSTIIGNKAGISLAFKKVNPKNDNPFLVTLMIQCCTVLVMCPIMSLISSVIFSIILGGAKLVNLPVIWIGTLMKNFPMALIWNLFFAAPFTRLIFKLIFKKTNTEENDNAKDKALD